jgi:hypothetical protein
VKEDANLDASSGRNTSHIECNGKTALLIHYDTKPFLFKQPKKHAGLQ